MGYILFTSATGGSYDQARLEGSELVHKTRLSDCQSGMLGDSGVATQVRQGDH